MLTSNRQANRLPFEFVVLGYSPNQWVPEDSLAILKYFQYETDESWQLDDLRQRVQEKGGDKLAALMFEQSIKTTHVSSLPNIGAPGAQDQTYALVKNAIAMLDASGIPPVSLPIWGKQCLGHLACDDRHQGLSSRQ